MSYDVIITDLDGTLLNRHSRLSNKTVEVFQTLKALNKVIVIASGRTYSEIVRLTEPLGLLTYPNAYFICYNGVLTIKTNPFEVLDQLCLHQEDVKSIVTSLGTKDVKYHVFCHNRLYISDDITLTLEHHLSSETEVIRTDMSHYDHVDPLYKVLIYDEIEKVNHLKKAMPKDLLDRYSVVKSSDQLLEIFHKEGSKGHALIKLVNHLSIDKQSVIAFGDEENDLSMLQSAGLGIAMANAKPAVLSAIKNRTLSNEFDGVANAINKYILKGSD